MWDQAAAAIARIAPRQPQASLTATWSGCARTPFTRRRQLKCCSGAVIGLRRAIWADAEAWNAELPEPQPSNFPRGFRAPNCRGCARTTWRIRWCGNSRKKILQAGVGRPHTICRTPFQKPLRRVSGGFLTVIVIVETPLRLTSCPNASLRLARSPAERIGPGRCA